MRYQSHQRPCVHWVILCGWVCAFSLNSIHGLAQSPERTVTFPEAPSLGLAVVRPWDSTDEEDWRLLGEAKGSLTVPAGHMLGLQFNRYMIGSIGALDAIEPDALAELNLTNAQLNESHLKSVGRLTGIRELSLVLTPIQDDWLAHLSAMTQLEKLDLGQTKISGAGLSHLAALPNLRSLGLHSTTITDAGLDSLVQIKSLENVGFVFTLVSSAGLGKLAAMQNLKRLDLVRLPDENVCMTLSKIPSLEEIYFHESDGVTDAALSRLSQLPQLRVLFVNSIAVTDVGLLALKAAPKLQKIELIRSKTTLAGVAEFHKTNPNCLIFR